ncbi:hypothetical protein K443DRAFT_9667 [Laccaria amethystina LaAM-08-1]|uniref:Uncharacterized protein n=1 Tax=Laccaria amethystina LaAM-08-1 TaxID=1095629 RepID=A0A0C9WY98_9AGAR|nr:hypothetical protein K443DRAFT_9667 [Laccaria amethystina LaAM-08-1]
MIPCSQDIRRSPSSIRHLLGVEVPSESYLSNSIDMSIPTDILSFSGAGD